MRINRLELKGFKSFKDQTVISFHDSLTGIVGPNGCGKSNVIDALVWVMGERSSKQMRGSQMSDLIFGGTEKYAPGGFAQVNLVLEKTHADFPQPYSNCEQLMVTRRLYSDGISEYLLNDSKARLKDVQELFLDTGAKARGISIIEQGKIGQIISAKPLERQFLIEEAAGISKFKVRKKESLNKLNSTQVHLDRLYDILRSQKRYLSSLERQAEKAKTYRGLKEQARSAEIKFKAFELAGSLAGAQSFESQILDLESEIRTIQTEVQKYSNETETSKVEALTLDKQGSLYRQQLEEAKNKLTEIEKQIISLDHKIETEGKAIESSKEQVQLSQTRLEELESKKSNLDESQIQNSKEAKEILARWEEIEKKYLDAKSEFENLEALQVQRSNDLNEIKEERFKLRSELDKCEQQKQWLEAQASEAEQKISQHTAKHEGLSRKKTQIDAQISNLNQTQMGFLNDKESLKKTLVDLNEQLNQCHENLQACQEENLKATVQVSALNKILESKESPGQKEILKWRQTVNTEVSLLQELIKPKPGFEKLVSAALENYKNWIIFQDAKSINQALKQLESLDEDKQQAILVNATIFAQKQDAFSSPTEALKIQGATALLDKVESFDNKCAELILERFFLVESVSEALALSEKYQQCHFVTQQGKVLFSNGVLFVGSAPESVFELCRQIKELEQVATDQYKKVVGFESLKKGLQAKISKVQEGLEKGQSVEVEGKLNLSSFTKDKDHLETESQALVELLNDLNQDLEGFKNKKNENTDSINKLSAELNEVEQRAQLLSSEFESGKLLLKETQSGLQAAQETKDSNLHKKVKAEAELSHHEKMVLSLSEQINLCLDEIQKSHEKVKASQTAKTQMIQTLESLKGKQPDVVSQIEQMSEKVENFNNQWQISQNTVTDFTSKISELLKKQSDLQVELARINGTLQDHQVIVQTLQISIQEKYQIDLQQYAQENKADLNLSEDEVGALKENMNHYLSEVEKLGQVSLTSIYEYDSLKKKYDFLNSQIEDLEKSKAKILKVITQLDAYCGKKFVETFEAINEKFKVVFPALFGGGKAHLSLVTYDDTQDIGVDITACPPGKTMKNINLLSGGEKAMSAVSLLFSIFLVNPSPFCLLDEVDAPLDDTNLNRFNNLVTQMSKHSQIVLITHNKLSMNICERLFGITMQERGVSKIVSVDMEKGLSNTVNTASDAQA